jgi:hypothetical protein
VVVGVGKGRDGTGGLGGEKRLQKRRNSFIILGCEQKDGSVGVVVVRFAVSGWIGSAVGWRYYERK